ncbi:MAG: hypothetical protein ACR2MP_34160 [Streptosporangiaceae bacterium]
MTTDIAEAEQAAGEAAQAVETAEAQLAAGKKGVTASTLHKLRDTYRHSLLATEGAKAKAERERAAARLAGLGEIGRQVDAAAAAAPHDLPAALIVLAAAAATVRDLAGQWDGLVAELSAAAADLGAEPAAPAGPRKSSAFVTVARMSIVHKLTELQPVGPKIDQAIQHALRGDTEAAAAAAVQVVTRAEPQRMDHHFWSPNGTVMAMTDPLPPGIAVQVRAGELRPLTAIKVDRYRAGELG